MNQIGVYKKQDMKNFIIIGAIFIVGCSKLPWKKGASSPDELFEEEPQVELNQLYGLHNKQGAEIKSHKTDIDYLESKIDSIGSDVLFIKEVLKNLQDQMKINKTSIGKEDTTDVNVVGEMAQLQMKVKLNKERVDRYTMFFDSVRFDMNERYVILDNEVSTLRKSLIEYISGSDASFDDVPVKKISDQEFREKYSKYYKNYINEDYDMSIRGFKELLSSNKSHDLSENCQYWMGEAYFAKGQYDIALSEFKKVFGFPNEKKEDDAQLKIGICYIKLEDNAKAKKELQNYIDQYPQGEFVAKAKSYLLQLD
ncbi:MAG: hypothetical protein CMG00_04610 [Candidatus Marinimicrobia bacterium]|nr:hypothetical protein [Candidatus Neomarinimicrobiota bacterium]|tara:strand:- start:10003 stop:10935 length:933 start_codon:yes stop_codon:yes gene_type:complete